MAKARPGRRVEFRLPEDHPFFTMVPLGERQEWLAKKVTAALLMESVKEKEPDEVIQRIEKKIDQIISVMADGVLVKSGVNISNQVQPPSEVLVPEKPKPAVKNLRALVDF